MKQLKLIYKMYLSYLKTGDIGYLSFRIGGYRELEQ